MKSIKTRLTFNFMLVIIITVFILEILLINFVKQYYCKNAEDILSNQIMISSEFYSRYFSNTTLKDNVLDNVDVFWKQTSAQVQIIDLQGNILMDSIGFISEKGLQSPDYQKALIGEKGTWIGRVEYDDQYVMSISYPLRSNDEIEGVLRFITSLSEINKNIKRISWIFISIGLVVIVISGAVSLFLSRSIIYPIKEVTNTAEKMALGNFKVRSKKKVDDEIGKLSDTLNYMAEEILKKDQLKNEFISSVSHEIRTPLTAIKGWAILLNSGELRDKDTFGEGLIIIEKESERLTSMVEELLDFSKFVSGKISLNREEIDIGELIQYIEKYMSPRASRENIKFIVEIFHNIPNIYIDYNRIKQVLINILDNAFKFTQRGGTVKLTASLIEAYLIISVQDNGCGISPEELPKIKDKFYKGKNSKSQNGIGLSISDEIVKLHDGSLEIVSELSCGTMVTIKLPVVNPNLHIGE